MPVPFVLACDIQSEKKKETGDEGHPEMLDIRPKDRILHTGSRIEQWESRHPDKNADGNHEEGNADLRCSVLDHSRQTQNEHEDADDQRRDGMNVELKKEAF